jgi:uncharacterized protein YcbK (DUF882 family)
MKIRSSLHFLIGAVCVVALPSPILLATTNKGAALLRSLIPTVPPALASTAEPALPPPAPPAFPLAGREPASEPGYYNNRLLAAPAPIAPAPEMYGPVLPPRGVAIQPLPTRETAVTVENVNTGEKATFFIGPSGRTRAEQAAAIEHFFRCRRTGRHKPLADSVLAMLVDIARRWPGRVVEVVSGYRSPPFGTAHSRHFAGHAIDLRVRGIRTSKVRDFIWRGHQEVGVGHYAVQNFVHIDSRPGQLDTAWSAPHEHSRPQYDPRWAKRARRSHRSIPGAMASLSLTAR